MVHAKTAIPPHHVAIVVFDGVELFELAVAVDVFGTAVTGPDGAPLYRLTPREKEVLRRIVAGQSTVQMAREMNIAIDTLRTYVKNVLAKLGAHTRLQAAALASREDLLGEMSA